MSAEVRPFTADDADAVANLFQKVFLHSCNPAPAPLVDYFVDTFCRHPWRDIELSSLVYVRSDGEIGGFIGVYPAPLQFGDRKIRAAFAGNLMVDGGEQDPLAGARLLRSFLSGPQELSLTETTNAISLGMWRKLGGEVVSNRSLNFVKVLRPATWFVRTSARRAPWLGLLSGPAKLVDIGAVRLMPTAAGSVSDGETVAPTDLADVVKNVTRRFILKPDFDDAALSFLLSHAAQKEKYGRQLARIVRNRRGQTVGGYLAHGQMNETLRVMQIFAAPANAELVLSDLFAQAVEMGAAAVNGRTQPEVLPSLLSAKCFFYSGGATAVHSRDPALLAAVHGPDNFLNGLAGETWSRLIGGSFSQREVLVEPGAVSLDGFTTAES